MIFSFIAGSLWRKDTSLQSANTQIISNLFCLYAFGCLFLPVLSTLVFLCVGYVLLFMTEYFLCRTKGNTETKEYLKMRLILTTIVALLHSVAITLL